MGTRNKIIGGVFGSIYGTFGSLGFFCLINWYAMAVFGEQRRYPNFYPFCIVFGAFSLVVCIGAFGGNIIYLIEKKGKKGTLRRTLIIEITATVLFFISGLFIFNLLYGLVSSAG